MKGTHNINKWSFIITAILHILAWASEFNFINSANGRAIAMFTLIAQALLGIIQLTLAIPMLISIKKYSSYIRKLIRTYWVLVCIYLVISVIVMTGIEDVFEPFILFTPMAIACYFVWVTFKASDFPKLNDFSKS